MRKYYSIEEAVSHVQSGNRVFVQGAAMTPQRLVTALCKRYKELSAVELVHLHTEGKALYTEEPYQSSFKVNSCFVGSNVRDIVNKGTGDYIPIFLSEVHLLFKRGILPLDIAFIQVSPPDKHGYCSLGTSVDITLSALKYAKKVIAEINPQVPRTHGDGIIHIKNIDVCVAIDEPIYRQPLIALDETSKKIGKYVAELIDDGATLQMGIGAIPNAVLEQLVNHKNLGIHTEMFSDGVLPLIEKGIITGNEKVIKNEKIVTSFAVGSQKLYDFLDDNPIVHFKEAAYTNDASIIRKNPRATAINSAIEIDITGQVCADTIGTYQYSGVGGQLDFMRGASLSEQGKAIMAMPSITKSGLSKIVPTLKHGANVTTTRAHIHYIATENGVVNLFGKNLHQRAKALLQIAHPSVQEDLEKAIWERFK
ncbi:acyl-CoA hydrolase [Mesonia hippocampi]|uniref:Acyl-CoA hydrolase n=1 Tax=Mesonia hippocampi TaxID=1628250 RepID=A0A840EWV4_9FLAO|nr:acetyl-CoA hydrolase/transferase family protein [Mesonia hippocampi]MBB4120056.1 acyl-CoA hydrolase [Mesonia hippocampi]